MSSSRFRQQKKKNSDLIMSSNGREEGRRRAGEEEGGSDRELVAISAVGGSRSVVGRSSRRGVGRCPCRRGLVAFSPSDSPDFPISSPMRTVALAVVVAEGRKSERKVGAVGVVWEGLLMFGAGMAARRSELGKMKLEEGFRWRVFFFFNCFEMFCKRESGVLGFIIFWCIFSISTVQN